MGQQRGKQTTPLLRYAEQRQEHQGEVIHLKDEISTPLKNTKQTQAIFSRQRTIGGIQWITEDMALLVGAIDSSTHAVEMLPRATYASCFHNGCTLPMKLPLVFDQPPLRLGRGRLRTKLLFDPSRPKPKSQKARVRLRKGALCSITR